MALRYGLNNSVDFASSKLVSFASVLTRTAGQPMDDTQLWYPLDGKTALERAQTYAASKSAFVGQELAVIDVVYEEDGTTVKETKAKIYVIQDEAGNLAELGAAAEIDADLTALDARLVKIEEFFKTADGETLDKALDTLIEIQQYIDDHGDLFLQLRQDVDNIYQPWKLTEDGAYEYDENGNRILAEKPTGALQDEIDRAIAAENAIYDADGATDAEGNPVATGLLVDETKRATAREDAIEDAIEVVYKKDADGKETGLLINEQNRAIAAEEAIYKATEVKDENGEVIRVDETGKLIDVKNEINDHIAALFSPNDGEGESGVPTGKIVDYIVDAVPVATLEKLGRVKASSAINQINVAADGIMEINGLSTDKLEQGAKTLVLDCGTSTEPLN